MKAYTNYKEIDYRWLGNIPTHWEWLFLSQTCHEQNIENSGNIENNILSLSYGKIIRKKNITFGLVPKNYDGYQIVNNNNIILRLIDLQNDQRSLRTGLVRERGIITSAYICLSPFQNAAYLQLLLHAYDVQKYFYGIGGGIRQSIGFKDIRYTMIPFPPREEQDHIVRWLDWQNAGVAKYIRVKKREIECLMELKKTIINKAVTKGLCKNIPMKDSGVLWLGDIPEHWSVVKIKRLFSESTERNTDLSAPLLSFSRNSGLIYFADKTCRTQLANDLSKYWIVRKGQLLENRMQAWSGMFICVNQFGCVSPDYSVFNKRIDINVKFYEYLFRSPHQVEQFAGVSKGVGDGFNRLYTQEFGEILTVCPPREEQDGIVAYLDDQCSAIDTIISKLTREIELLAEYKTRITSDAVTGKIDLRGVEIPDFEPETEETADTNDIQEEDSSDAND